MRASISVGLGSAWEAVGVHRLRSAVTLLAVSIGVASVLAVAAYGQYASAQVSQVLAQFGSNMVVVAPAPPQTRSARVGRVNTLTTDDADAIMAQVPHLLQVSGVKAGSLPVTARRYTWTTQVAGVSESFASIQGLEIASGTFLSSEDERNTAAVAVLGLNAAAQLFPNHDAVGSTVRISGSNFRVVGVLAARGRSADGDLDDVIYVPLSTALRRVYGGATLDRVEARVDESAHIASSMLAITSVLEARHHVGIGKPDDFEVQDFQRVADRTSQTLAAVSTGITAGAVLALTIAGFGIMNIMLLSISERTPEIGIRLAVGARGSDVRVQFLAEALTLCLGGVLLGCLVSFAGTTIVSQQVHVLVVPHASDVALAAAISSAVGLVFALYPADRAARLDPVVALRTD